MNRKVTVAKVKFRVVHGAAQRSEDKHEDDQGICLTLLQDARDHLLTQRTRYGEDCE